MSIQDLSLRGQHVTAGAAVITPRQEAHKHLYGFQVPQRVLCTLEQSLTLPFHMFPHLLPEG